MADARRALGGCHTRWRSKIATCSYHDHDYDDLVKTSLRENVISQKIYRGFDPILVPFKFAVV